MNLNKAKFPSGMSMIEVMAAFWIISIALIGILSLAIYTIRASRVSRSYLTASMLAQEGLEIVRSIRDTNWRNAGNNWFDNICGKANGDFSIDYRGISFISDINGIANAPLYIDGNGFYNNAGPTATIYSRLVKVIPDNDPTNYVCDSNTKYLIVTSEVAWQSGGQANSYKAETRLYNWR